MDEDSLYGVGRLHRRRVNHVRGGPSILALDIDRMLLGENVPVVARATLPQAPPPLAAVADEPKGQVGSREALQLHPDM